jgi:surfeit locus 1 family protein
MSETRRFPIAATICTLLAFIVLCGLGTWQVQRLHWKQQVLADFQRMYAQDAALTALTEDSFKNPEGAFMRGTAEGTLVFRDDILVGPRTRNQKPGYHLITPLLLADGAALLVNRGWIAQEEAQSLLGLDSKRPDTRMKIAGVAHRSPRPSMALRNNPAAGDWYWIEIPAVAAHFKLPRAIDFVLQSEDGIAPAGRPYPAPLPHMPAPPNNHRQYAFTWYSLAAALLVIYGLRFLKPYFAGKPA